MLNVDDKSTLNAMANNPLTMSKIRHVLRLYFQKKGKKAISEQTGIARNTIRKYILIFRSLNIPWDELNKLSDSELEKHILREEPKEPSKRLDELQAYFPTVDKRRNAVGYCGRNIRKRTSMPLVLRSSASTTEAGSVRLIRSCT